MAKSVKVEVDLKVFKWLRLSAGWSIQDIAKRLKTSVAVVGKIESGERNPTFRQLNILSSAYRRPVAAFLLSKPKEEKPIPKDYRMLPGKKDVFDKKTILVLRKARDLQEIGRELSKNIDYQTKPKIERVNVSINPKELGGKYREKFDLTEEKQKSFKTPYKFFNYLRDTLEDMNILVFQFSMPVEDARGFVFVDEFPNTIVINTKDTIEARIFSLMHEFGHILLGESVIDFPDLMETRKNEFENWCDEFASSLLLPENISKPVFDSNRSVLTDTKTLKTLSRSYKLSKAMLLVNMRKLQYITKNEYEDVLNRYKPKDKKKIKKGEKQGGGLPSDKRCLSQIGTKFVSIVANNYDSRLITYTDALNYLSIKSKSFDKVLVEARK